MQSAASRGQSARAARLGAVLALAAAVAVGGAAGAGTLRVAVHNNSGVDQVDAPVTAGVPWPCGALTSPHELRLLAPGREEVPLQVTVLARWASDNSLKWTLLDFQASVKAKEPAAYELEYGPGVRRGKQAAKALLLEADGKHVTVSSGLATMKVRKQGFNLLDHVSLSGQDLPLIRDVEPTAGLRLQPVEEPAVVRSTGETTAVKLRDTDRVFLGRHAMSPEWFHGRGVRVVEPATGKEIPGVQVVGASLDREGRRSAVGHGWCSGLFLHLNRAPGREVQVSYPRAAAEPALYTSGLGESDVAVELEGPVRSVVRAAGKFTSKDGKTLCDYVARLHFYAGKPWVRLELTVVNREKMPLSQGLDTYPLLLRDLSVRLPLRFRGLMEFALAGDRGLGTTHRGDLRSEKDEAKLVQFAGRTRRLTHYRVTRDIQELASGEVSAGGVGLRDATEGAVAVVRRLWQSNPKALRVSGEGWLELGLFPHEATTTEGLLAGRAKTHDILVAFHGPQAPDLLGLCALVDHPLTASVAGAGEDPYTGRWVADTGVIPLAPLAGNEHDRVFGFDARNLAASLDGSGSRGVWTDGARGAARCRTIDFVVDRADASSIQAAALIGIDDPTGLAVLIDARRGVAAGRTEPLTVAAGDARTGVMSFVREVAPLPPKGTPGVLYDLHGTYLCHRSDLTYAFAREFLRRGTPELLETARVEALHLADVCIFRNVEGASPAWTGACQNCDLGPTAHFVPGLSRESSWVAGAWLTALLTGDRAILSGALANADFAARHADDADTSPVEASLAIVNLCFATDVAPALAPDKAAVYKAALEAYVGKLLDSQRRSPGGLYGDNGVAAGLALEALAMARSREADERIERSVLQAAEALIRPDRFWSGHDKAGRLRRPDGRLVKPYGTSDGVVADRASHPELARFGPVCALVAPHLAAATETTGDTKYIKKARRLERIATRFRSSTADDIAFRYRSGDLFAAIWARYLAAHPQPDGDGVVFQCRLENAADVALPDLGVGGSVFQRPFVALPDGTRAYQAQATDVPRLSGVGLWFPLLGSGNVVPAEGTLEFRICYRKGPGRREAPWMLSGDPQRHGFALGLKGDDLELVTRYRDQTGFRVVHRGAKLTPGTWHHVAFTWRPTWGTDLYLDGKPVAHHRRDHIVFSARLDIPAYPDDKTNEYLIDDLRIWKRALTTFGAVADTAPPAAVTDLRLEPADGGRLRLSWTAPGDDGKEGQARRYDIRVSTQRFGPISWGGYADSADPTAAIHWAEADRIATAPKPQPAGRLETLVIGPFPKQRRLYVALKTEDEAHASPLSNVVTNAVNHPPVADPGFAERHVITGSSVALNALGSSDPDYDDLTYEWSCGVKGPTGVLKCDKPGTQEIALTVSDGKAQGVAKSLLVVGSTVRVSFQPRAAAAPKGFMVESGETYTAARGFGWRHLPPGTSGFARTDPKDVPPEARSGLRFPTGAEWVLDLPDGLYKLSVVAGDPAHLEGRRRVFAEGKELFNVELAGTTKPHAVDNHRIHVTGGQLSLHVGVPPAAGQRSTEGGEINALVVERVD